MTGRKTINDPELGEIVIETEIGDTEAIVQNEKAVQEYEDDIARKPGDKVVDN